MPRHHRVRRVASPPLLALLALAAPAAARAATLTVEDPLASASECSTAASQEVKLSWDLGSSSGSSVELLASNASGCSESDATTAVLASSIPTSQAAWPSSGDTAITLADVLAAAGRSTADCAGSSFRVYVCVRLLDGSGAQVTTASAAIRFQLEKPPPPTGLATEVGDGAIYASWSAGTATAAAPAASSSYQAFASAGGVTHASAETTSKSARIGGLDNGTTYDVWVVAYSEAGNPSDASELGAATPRQVLDFFSLYQASGGAERGGCSQGGPADLLALLGALALLRLRRPRRVRDCSRPGGANPGVAQSPP
ncbi:MAG TPA: fibronectin type III domain-containing protein [Anaeromyxobacteraceae bacterium]|nr:fibronectin type III domain-containing protein [Anaeromyxobacteraceae bacterium]